MKHVQKSVLLPYTSREMYDLVTDIRHYPEFLPWCNKAEVLEESATRMTARIGLAYKGVRHSFTTRNTQVLAESVIVELVDGPFSVLDGSWLFRRLGKPDSNEQACKIEFDLRYAFASKALEFVVSPVFDRIANNFVESFVKRAESVYGER